MSEVAGSVIHDDRLNLEGDVISTEIPPEGLWPSNWSKVLEAMGHVLVRAIGSRQGDAFDVLARSETLKIGAYIFSDIVFSGLLTLADGRFEIQAETS